MARHDPTNDGGALPAWLIMEMGADGRNKVYPDPRRVRSCLAPDFAESIGRARQAVSEWWPDHPAMRWRLDPWSREHAASPLLLEGTSLGAAFAANMISLCRRMPARSRCAVTAGVDEAGRLVPVSDAGRKIAAAHRAGIRHVIVAEEQELPDGRPPDAVAVYQRSDVWHAAHLIASPYRQANHPPPRGADLRDATLAEVDTRIYLIANGRRCHVPSPPVLEQLVFRNPDLPDVSWGCEPKHIDVFPSGPGVMGDGFVVTDTSSAVYIVENDHKRLVESRDALEERGYGDVLPVPMADHVVDALATGDPVLVSSAAVELELACYAFGKPGTEFAEGVPIQVVLTPRADGYTGVPYLRETMADGAVAYYCTDDRDFSMSLGKTPRKAPLRTYASGEPARRPLGADRWVACTFIAGAADEGRRRLDAWFEDVNGPIAPGHETEPAPIAGVVAETSYTVSASAGGADPRALLIRSGRQTRLSPPVSLPPCSYPGTSHRHYVYRELDLAEPTAGLQYLQDGLILKGDGPSLYLYQDGARRPFRSGAAFQERRYTFDGDWADWTYMHLPEATIRALTLGPYIEEHTATVTLRLHVACEGRAENSRRQGGRVGMQLSVRGDGYTAYLHVRAAPPGGEPRYVIATDNGIALSDDKAAFHMLPDGTWLRHNVSSHDWHVHSWAIAEDAAVGEWTWEAWLEDVNIVPGTEGAAADAPVPVSGAVAHATCRVLPRR